MEHYRFGNSSRPTSRSPLHMYGSPPKEIHSFRSASRRMPSGSEEREDGRGTGRISGRPSTGKSEVLYGSTALPSRPQAQRMDTSSSGRASNAGSTFSDERRSGSRFRLVSYMQADFYLPMYSLDPRLSRVSQDSGISIRDMDIESLLSSYDSFIHPAHRERLHERHDALLAAQAEAGYTPRTSVCERPSTPSERSYTHGLGLPVATSQPVRPSTSMARKSSNTSSIFKRKTEAGPTWLSGEIAMDHSTNLNCAGQSSNSMSRKPSATSLSSHTMSASGLTRKQSQSSSIKSGPLERALSAQNIERDFAYAAPAARQLQRTVSEPQGMPVPQRSMPARFQYARRDSEDRSSQQTHATTYSPRSSTSSQPNSFRWSMSSRETASTACSSRTSSQQMPTSILEALESAESNTEAERAVPASPIIGQSRRPSGMGHRKDMASIDSLDSLNLESIAAMDFPVPPPISRKNSVQSTTTIPSAVESGLSIAVNTSAPMSRDLSSSSSRSQSQTGVLNRAILNASLARSRRSSDYA